MTLDEHGRAYVNFEKFNCTEALPPVVQAVADNSSMPHSALKGSQRLTFGACVAVSVSSREFVNVYLNCGLSCVLSLTTHALVL